MNKHSFNALRKHPGYNGGGGGGGSAPSAAQPQYAASWTRAAPTAPTAPSRPALIYNTTPSSGLQGLLAAQEQYNAYGPQMMGFGRSMGRYQQQLPAYRQSVADYNTAAQLYNTANQGKIGYQPVGSISAAPQPGFQNTARVMYTPPQYGSGSIYYV